jgi:hypothetical protein
MRFAVAALALAAAPMPALATSGLECRPVSGSGPRLTMTIGHAAVPALISVRMVDGQRVFTTGAQTASGGTQPVAVGRSWIDERYLWLDLLDVRALRFEAKMRATFQPKMRGRPALGTLIRAGRTYRMRCVEA